MLHFITSRPFGKGKGFACTAPLPFGLCCDSSSPSKKEKSEGGDGAVYKIKTVNAYVGGKFLCDVLQEALNNNKMLGDMKKILSAEYPGIEFRIEEKMIRKAV